jgi:hydrogenase maturation protein HypF
MGRIFDAVSALLSLCDNKHYEGQAAMLFDQSATTNFVIHGLRSNTDFYNLTICESEIQFDSFLSEIAHDIRSGRSTPYIAAKFHASLIQLIATIAVPYKYIAFSGGVFQNALLVDLGIEYLKEEYQLCFHQQLSTNDENVSVGQVGYGMGLNDT